MRSTTASVVRPTTCREQSQPLAQPPTPRSREHEPVAPPPPREGEVERQAPARPSAPAQSTPTSTPSPMRPTGNAAASRGAEPARAARARRAATSVADDEPRQHAEKCSARRMRRGPSAKLARAQVRQVAGCARHARPPEERGGEQPQPAATRRLTLQPFRCASRSSPTSTVTCTPSRRSWRAIERETPGRALVPRRPRRLRAAAEPLQRPRSPSAPTLCLAGNHDLAALGELAIEEFSPDAARQRGVDAQRAHGRDARAFLETLEPQARAATASSSSTAARATRSGTTCSAPTRPAASFEATNAPLVLVGHSHVALAIRATTDERWRAASPPPGPRSDLDGRPLAPQPRLGRPAARRRSAGGLPPARPRTRRRASFRRVEYPVEKPRPRSARRGYRMRSPSALRTASSLGAAALGLRRRRWSPCGSRLGRRLAATVAERLATRSDRVAARLDAGDRPAEHWLRRRRYALR